MNVIMILALLATVAATVLAYIFIIPEKKRATLNKFGKFVHDLLNFKFLIVEKLVQFFYVLLTAFVICLGFFMLFYVQSYGWGYTQWYGGYGLLLMIVGPIVVRLSYELIMMAILVVKNVIQINNKLKNQNEGKSADPFSDDAAKDYEFTLPKKEKKEPVYSAPTYYAPPQPAPEPQPAPQPVWQPAPEPQPVVRNFFCSECGSRLGDNGVCPNCGK